jgi:hypothetical protein
MGISGRGWEMRGTGFTGPGEGGGRSGKAGSVLEPSALTPMFGGYAALHMCVRHLGCHLYFARRKTLQTCADSHQLHKICYQG